MSPVGPVTATVRRSPIVVEHDPRGLAVPLDARLDRADLVRRAHSSSSSAVAKRASTSRFLIVGKTISRSPASEPSSAPAGANQRASTISPPSGTASAPSGATARKKYVSKRIETSGGVIQRENATSAPGSGSVIADLLEDLAHGRGAWAASPRPRARRPRRPGTPRRRP